MDRKKEKIIECTIIGSISVALLASIIAFNDAHAQLRVSDSLRALEGIRIFSDFGTGPTPAPIVPSTDRCRLPEECRTHFSGGIRG